MPQAAIRWVIARYLFLMVMPALVHAAAATTVCAEKAKSPLAGAEKNAAKVQQPAIKYGLLGLPAPVLEMRDAILTAVNSGQIEDILVAIEMNELKPVFGDGPAADPIAYLKAQSGDGDGRSLLAALGAILDAGYAEVPLGRDVENNLLYVWPYFAEIGLKDLTLSQALELNKIVPEANAAQMRADGKYTFWRIVIGADGTWHILAR